MKKVFKIFLVFISLNIISCTRKPDISFIDEPTKWVVNESTRINQRFVSYKIHNVNQYDKKNLKNISIIDTVGAFVIGDTLRLKPTRND